MREMMLNTHTRVWLATPDDRQLTYKPGTGVDSFFVESKRMEVALRVRMPDPLMESFKLDALEIWHGICGDPSEYGDGELLARFTNMELRRIQVEEPVVMQERPDWEAVIEAVLTYAANGGVTLCVS